MAKYEVVERSFIGNRVVEPGAIVEVEFTNGGVAGPNLKAVITKKLKPAAPAAPASDSGDGEKTGDDLS